MRFSRFLRLATSLAELKLLVINSSTTGEMVPPILK